MSRFFMKSSATTTLLVVLVVFLFPGPGFCVEGENLLPSNASPAIADAEPQIRLHKGSRIVLVGNTLAERMQHFGHWETLLHSRFPELELVVRNLGWSADELTIQLRSKRFQDHGHSLADHEPDVVLAFFGFNESFAGPEGVAQFEKDLAAFIKRIRGLAREGKPPVQLVLVSPIANEQLRTPNAPDVARNQDNLQLYTDAMARVARRHNVPMVDLLQPTRRLFEQTGAPLTINGIHLNDSGDRAVAEILDEKLFGARPKASDKIDLEKLRAEVNEKNRQFYYDYRAVNGCYIYGRRKAPFGIINFPLEFAKLRQMIAARDRRIWDVAQGKPVPETIDDSHTIPLPMVETNVNEPAPITSPEESQRRFTLPDDFQIGLFASEVQFPELKNPVAMTFDSRGRLWVATMASYPQYLPGTPPNDKVLILEDVDHDGKADTCKVFADKLYLPTGLELGHGGLYLAQQPNLLFLKDTDGDDRADVREIILHGFDSADSHHALHTFVWDPGMALYFQEGTFHHTQVETPYGPERCIDAGVFRFEPRTWKFDVFISFRFANPWGHCFDRWGQDFIADASTGLNYLAAPFSGDVDFPDKHVTIKPLYEKQWRPTSGCELVSSRHFPPEMQGNFLVNNVIGLQGTLQFRVREEGSGVAIDPVDPLVRSSDPNFRPVDLEFAPDGSLMIVDWFNPLVGHMQHSLRDPNRDTSHGRIWRVTHKTRPLLEPASIEGQPIPALLNLLKSEEDRTRYRARIELSTRDSREVMAALDDWIETLDQSDPDFQHQLLEALWARQQQHQVDQPLLERVLQSPEPRARAAATRVLCYWRESLKEPLELLQTLVDDEHPRVRLEAVRALSFFEGADVARSLALVDQAAAHPTDYHLSYALRETKRTLNRRLRSREQQLAESAAALASKGDPENAPSNPIDTPITTQEMKRLVAEVLKDGDAARGEEVFRRDELNCYRCHAIERAGGSVGPDLSSVGTTSPVDHLVHSILNPSLVIKEQYETKQFVTVDGLQHHGIVVDRDYAKVTVKRHDDSIVKILNREIEEEHDGRSLMPAGLTQKLTHQEFLDLVRFLYDLGRPGPFALPAEPSIWRWRVLKTIPKDVQSDLDDPPAIETLCKRIVDIDAGEWLPAYAKVSGQLPLADVVKLLQHDGDAPTMIVVQGEIQVLEAGEVHIAIEAPPGTIGWISETRQSGDSLKQLELELPAGRHKLTLAIPRAQPAPAESSNAGIRVKLRKPSRSSARFEPVGGA